MSGLFGVLNVAGRGLLVSQQGVRNASNNIANVNTPGYSRQRQIVQSVPPIPSATGNLGQGAEQITVERVVDAFVQAKIVSHNSASGSTDVQAQSLSTIEEVFNEQTGAGIGVSLSRLYSAFSDLASSQTPGAPIERETLRAAARNLIDTLHGADASLRAQMDAAEQSVQATLGEINTLTGRIAELNQKISQAETTAPANELRDERDGLVRELGRRIQIHTFQDGNAQVVLLPSGQPLVEAAASHPLVAVADTANPFDPAYTRIGVASGSTVFDITDDIGGGELGGLLRTRDTLLPGAIRSLDTIAYNLMDSVNSVHNLGVGLDGTTGDFFAALPGVEDAARNLALDANIDASVDAIAAGLTTAPGDNRNALAMAELRETAAPVFLPGDPPGPATGPTRTLLDHVAGIVADVGQQSSAMQAASDQNARVGEVLADRRDEVSAVSLDEEVTQLVQLQAAFQANARVMVVVDRLLEDVLSLV